MPELIVTCAGCGKRYRGAASGKKSKCGTCGNLLSFPEEPRSPSPGKLLCSNCWHESEPTSETAPCPSCQQKIAPKIGGKASSMSATLMPKPARPTPPPTTQSGAQVLTETQTPPAPPPVEPPQSSAAPASSGPPAGEGEMDSQLAEVILQRDTALDARRQQDKVVAELMAQLAFAKAAQVSQGTDEPAKWELQMEVGELRSKVDSLGEQQKVALKDRDDARKARDEIDEARRKLEARLHELEAQLAQLEQAQVLSQQQAAAASGQAVNAELERRSTQLDQDLATAREERAAAIRERDEALAKANAASADLDNFRQAAVQALEPLGLEYNRAMKELIVETDGLLLQARQQHEEAQQRMGQLESLGASLKEHLIGVRREMAQRLAAVLGSPAEESQVQTAVNDSSDGAAAEPAPQA